MRYYLQFVAGTGSLLLEALECQFDRLRVWYADDSAIILESATPPNRVAAIPFIKNAFVVIAETRRGSLDKGALQLSRVVANRQFPRLPGMTRAFRLMAHIDGSLAPIDPRAKAALERAVAGRTGARVEPRGLCQEYWVVGRKGMSELMFCARLAKSRRPAKVTGAISYELSAMLIAASQPSPQDVFLDPFGGSGSFALARLDQPVRQLWYSDLNLAQHRRGFDPILTKNKRVRLLSENALILPSIADGSADVIVTDPPWGEHEKVDASYAEFALAIGRSFARVLHPTRGRYVLLVNRQNARVMCDGLSATSLMLYAEHEILVNGHPATVFIGKCQGGAAVDDSVAINRPLRVGYRAAGARKPGAPVPSPGAA